MSLTQEYFVSQADEIWGRAIAYRLKSVMIAHFGSELVLKTACITSNVDIMLSCSGYSTVNKADMAPITRNST